MLLDTLHLLPLVQAIALFASLSRAVDLSRHYANDAPAISKIWSNEQLRSMRVAYDPQHPKSDQQLRAIKNPYHRARAGHPDDTFLNNRSTAAASLQKQDILNGHYVEKRLAYEVSQRERMRLARQARKQGEQVPSSNVEKGSEHELRIAKSSFSRRERMKRAREGGGNDPMVFYGPVKPRNGQTKAQYLSEIRALDRDRKRAQIKRQKAAKATAVNLLTSHRHAREQEVDQIVDKTHSAPQVAALRSEVSHSQANPRSSTPSVHGKSQSSIPSPSVMSSFVRNIQGVESADSQPQSHSDRRNSRKSSSIPSPSVMSSFVRNIQDVEGHHPMQPSSPHSPSHSSSSSHSVNSRYVRHPQAMNRRKK